MAGNGVARATAKPGEFPALRANRRWHGLERPLIVVRERQCYYYDPPGTFTTENYGMPDAGTTVFPGGALRPISFSSEDFAASEALDAWRGWFGGLNEYIPKEGTPFAARVDYWRLGRFVLAGNVSSPLRLVRDRARARRDGLDHWVLRVSRHGIVRSRSGDRTYVSHPGELVLERLSGCYEDDWSADAWVALIFAPGDFPEIDRTLAGLGTGPVAGARSGLVADYLLALEQRLQQAQYRTHL